MADGKKETLAIPEAIRRAVTERDQGHCRFCGRTDGLAIHHVRFGGDVIGMGGRRQHRVPELLTVGSTPWHDCHSILHKRKNLWQPYALLVVNMPGVTMLQLRRWAMNSD